ncbi:hypothetical protein A3K80_04965 [Candidatus Bathyarchaeota archaeon RBG_13_38_9]|nr:MAG: hypothetical protein A3K80_04965 [Candidatus Bathyarchaeota archaeon RBG_13_38_9]
MSVCIPSYNGARWIREAIDSAQAQTYKPLEIVIVDDASTDNTLEIIRSYRDPRIRIEVNKKNLGPINNWNRCIKLAKGSLIKFLHQDDVLYPTCVEKMVRLFGLYQQIGLVFAQYDVLLENPIDPTAIVWKERYQKLNTQFQYLSEVNNGRELFKTWLADGFKGNWIGGPSNVMLRKAFLEHIGMFNTRLREIVDYELWIRMMYFYDIGFINETLSTYRKHLSSLSASNIRQDHSWLDRLWFLEGFIQHEDIRSSYPRIKRLRYLEFCRLVINQINRIRRREPIQIFYKFRTLAYYFNYYVRALIGHPPPLHEYRAL